MSHLDIPQTPDPGLDVAPLGALHLPQLSLGHPGEVGRGLGRRHSEGDEGEGWGKHEGGPGTSRAGPGRGSSCPSCCGLTRSCPRLLRRMEREGRQRRNCSSGHHIEQIRRNSIVVVVVVVVWLLLWLASLGLLRLGLTLLLLSLSLQLLKIVSQCRHLLLEQHLCWLLLLLLLLLWLLLLLSRGRG